MNHTDDHTWGPKPWDDSSDDADHTGEPPRGNRTEDGRRGEGPPSPMDNRTEDGRPPMPGKGMMDRGQGRGPRKGRDAKGGKGGEKNTPPPKPNREDHTDHPLRNCTGGPDAEDHTGEPQVRRNHTDGERPMGGGKGGEGRRGTPPPKPNHEDHTDHPHRDRTGGPDASADNSEDHTGEPPVQGRGPRKTRDVRGGRGGEGRGRGPPPKPSHEDHTDHPLRDRTGGPDNSADEDHTGRPDHTRGPVEDHTGAGVKPEHDDGHRDGKGRH